MLLPCVALAALTAVSPVPAELVARIDGRLHLYAPQHPGLRDFTRGGALRVSRRPVCGQRARRWYLAEVDSRALCGRCTAWARRHLDLTAGPLTVAQLVEVLAYASSLAEVDAVQSAAIHRSVTSALVSHPDPHWGPVRMHTLIAHTRSRLSRGGLSPADHAWWQRVANRPSRPVRRSA